MPDGGDKSSGRRNFCSCWWDLPAMPIHTAGLGLTGTDNTNADQAVRAVWIQLAQRFNVPIRCVHFTASTKLCEHNDTIRAIAGGPFNPEQRNLLPHSAFSSFGSRYKQPKLEEGFQDVVPVDFQVG